MIYKFTEVLNDLINYFILGDLLLMHSWKEANKLSDDLATEFTTNESADVAFSEGIMIPMSGIENYPYTVLFNLSEDTSELAKESSRLQFKREGYSLKIENNMLALFTWPILNQFNLENIEKLIDFNRQHSNPIIEIPNGWYQIEILGGETLQEQRYEPTLEFMIQPVDAPKVVTADMNMSFQIISSEH